MRSLHVEANGLRHHVVEWAGGSDDRPVAWLIHGFQDAGASWELVAPHFVDAGFRVVAPDLRGFGEGPRAPSGSYYHFPDYIADMAELVEALVPANQPLFVVGHSMGGTVATLYTGTYPERVTKLAVLEGLGPPDNPFDVAPDRMRRWIEDMRRYREPSQARPLADIDDAARRLAVSHASVSREALVTRARHLVTPTGNGAEVSWRFDPLHRSTSPFPFFAGSLRAFASRATCPVLVIGGGPHGYKPPDNDERVAAFKDVSRLELEDAGHMMHWTKASELAGALLAFWSRGALTA